MPIIVEYAYNKGNGIWSREFKKFHDPNKAIRFIYMMNSSAKMVYMALHCDDSYDDLYIRRKCHL